MKTSIIQAFSGVIALAVIFAAVLQGVAAPVAQVTGLKLNAHDVREFGAVGDGVTLNTVAIQRAIDVIAQEGGGRLIFPAPGTYLTGTIFLKDNTTLDIQAGATILSSQLQGDYSKNVDRFPYLTEAQNCVLICARKVHNIGLTGWGARSTEMAPDAPTHRRSGL
jgi:polygalacturonase